MLVISVDTSIGHLAGALGRPTFLLLPGVGADWRWMTERGDSPWYPNHRLFRGAVDGGEVTVSTDAGSITLPVVVTAMPDGVVWLPANSDGSTPRATLGAGHGDVVRIAGGAA